MPLSPNQPLDEFKIIRRLGAGGFGAVYQAQDTLLNRPVAIKELYAPRAADNDAFHRFLQEARTAGSLNHPNIVTVYGLRVKGDTHYLILEYVPGGSLRDRLKREGKLEVSQAVQIAAEVAEALAVVHARGIIHRDIKPENILLAADGHAKVTDFGIAHVPREAGGQSLTQTGFQPGTILYMSPEQIRGEELTGASDVYQLAAVLHEMVTGRHYFDPDALLRQAMQEMKATNPQAPAVQARWMMLVGQAIERPIAVRSSGHPELAQLVENVLSSAVTARPTARQLAQVLRGGGSGPSQTRRETPNEAIVTSRVDVSPYVLSSSSTRSPVQDVLERFRTYRLSPLDRDKALAEITLFMELASRGMVTPSEAEEFRNEFSHFDFVEILGVQARDAFEHAEFDKCIGIATRIIEFEPNALIGWWLRGMALRAKREFDKAIADLTRAIERAPRNAVVWSSRGEAHLMRGEYYATISDPAHDQESEYDQAIADFTRALELNPEDVTWWTRRAYAHWVKREYEARIADLARVLELDPENAWVLGQRGYTYQTLGDYDKAIEDLSHALDIEPFNGIHWRRRGECYLSKGVYSLAERDFHKAVECHSKSIEQNPNDDDAYNSRAWTLLLQGENIEQALQDANRAVSLNPVSSNHYGTRGTACAVKKDYINAQRDFDESLRLKPDELDYYLRAVVRQRLGDAEGAEGDFAEAKKLNPNVECYAGAQILSRPPLRKLVEQQEAK